MAEPKSNFRRGDVLTAEWANAVAEATGVEIRTGAGLAARRSRGRISITAISHTKGTGSLAKSTSTFNVASGTTPGTGTLDLYYMDESGPTATGTGESVSAYTMVTKAQASGKAINNAQWCWADKDRFGVWFCSPLECS